jgi:hypothetical protein
VQDVMSPIHLGSQDESLDVKHNVAFELWAGLTGLKNDFLVDIVTPWL